MYERNPLIIDPGPLKGYRLQFHKVGPGEPTMYSALRFLAVYEAKWGLFKLK